MRQSLNRFAKWWTVCKRIWFFVTLKILSRTWVLILQLVCQVYFIMFSLEYEHIRALVSCIIKEPFVTVSLYSPYYSHLFTNQNVVPLLKKRKNLRKWSSIRIFTQLSNPNMKGKKPFKFKNIGLGGITVTINFRPLILQKAPSYNLFHKLIKLHLKCSLFLSRLF